MSKRPTIQMVAEAAGVSRGTVDRVLNHRAHVNPEVRERVLLALKETGYISPREKHQQQLEGEPLTLGVLLPNFDDQFQEEVTRGIEQARAELAFGHVQVLVRRCKTDIPQEAVDLLEDLVAQKAAGLAVCALNDLTIQNRIRQLTEARLPCVTFNSDLPESGRLAFAGQDIHQAGRVAADLMSKCVAPGDRILATAGNLKFDGHRQRLSGFQERLGELGYPPDRILTAETFNDYQTSFAVVRDAIADHPDLRGIYMANLNVAGCVEAVRAAGKTGKIRVICHDINESVRQMLLSGSVDFTIPQDLVRQGYAPLMMLRDYLCRGTLQKPLGMGEKIDILCAENLPAATGPQ